MEYSRKNFSEWYNEIVELSELTDKRYPVKGMNVWMPYGFDLMRNIDEMVRERFRSDDFGEVMFPALISRTMFEVEFEHIKGFEKELFWITKGGRETLEDDLAMRPTSEAAMYPMFRLWIRDHSDLPLRLFQVVQVWRYETKHTRPFMRSRDIHFTECHTAHENFNDAEAQLQTYRDEWNYFTHMLCLPFMEVERPDWDKFPGAVYTRAFDTIMPSGRTLQIGTIHQYGQNFARNYDVKFARENGESEYVFQTTFGMSERLVAAVVSIHGDDKGLILPPYVAPVQVVIVPIPGKSESLASYTSEIFRKVRELGIRAKIDARDSYTPGYKYNFWEMKGVPLRIEIGDREVEEKSLTLRLRTEKGRIKMALSDISGLGDMLEKVSDTLRARALKILEDNLSGTAGEGQESRIETHVLCNRKECSDSMEKRTELTMMGHIMNRGKEGKCEVCGNEGRTSLFSRPY
ncbi:MAG: proline--tRNA ligase [Candidatus Thermoplasmatota archaeon]|nr:proline--tRNA ligase [Candidatus Thermoplasmatota archaeon]MCL5790678.1 proline--tRNA ligase [Candidatus Thermoplasmatota archaeon]